MRESLIDKKQLGYDIFRKPYFFALLAQGWLKTFNHLHFFFVLLSWKTNKELPLHPGLSGPTILALKMVWCLVSLLRTHFRSADCWLPGLENFCHYIFLRHLCTLQMQFVWHFRCPLFTLNTSCFEIHEPTWPAKG